MSKIGSVLSILAAAMLSSSSQVVAASPDEPASGSCPCMGGGTGGMGSGMMCGQMGQMANVAVENTSNGAVVRFSSKDPDRVEAVRQMAQRMGNCMSGSMMSPPPPAKQK